jgi:hypothetical protein
VDLFVSSCEKVRRCPLGTVIMSSSVRHTHLSRCLCIHSHSCSDLLETALCLMVQACRNFVPMSERIKFSTLLECNALCLVEVHRHSRGMYYLHHQRWIVSQESSQQEAVLFIDNVKAFYRVLQRKLWDMWVKGCREHLIQVIKSLSWLRHCATSWKVVGLIPDVVGFFSWPNPSSCTMAQGSTQP